MIIKQATTETLGTITVESNGRQHDVIRDGIKIGNADRNSRNTLISTFKRLDGQLEKVTMRLDAPAINFLNDRERETSQPRQGTMGTYNSFDQETGDEIAIHGGRY